MNLPQDCILIALLDIERRLNIFSPRFASIFVITVHSRATLSSESFHDIKNEILYDLCIAVSYFIVVEIYKVKWNGKKKWMASSDQ